MKKLGILGIGLLLFVSCKKEEKTEPNEPTVVDIGINGKFEVDSTSTMAWIGSKPTGKHNGTIQIKNGEFTIEKGIITEGKFTIDMNSITVEDLEGEDKIKLEDHLKGTNKPEAADHFFNVTKFPFAEFVVTGFVKENRLDMIEGDLTIKNKTNKVKFPISISESNGLAVLKTPAFKINRTLWDITYGSKSFFDNLEDKFIDDEISLEINLKAIRTF